jgi:hypothetical protein
MRRLVGVWTYRLGLASAAIALVIRAFNAFGMWLPGRLVEGVTVWYMSFYKATLLFLLISIATALEICVRVALNEDARPLRPAHKDQSFVSSHSEVKVRAARAGA